MAAVADHSSLSPDSFQSVRSRYSNSSQACRHFVCVSGRHMNLRQNRTVPVVGADGMVVAPQKYSELCMVGALQGLSSLSL